MDLAFSIGPIILTISLFLTLLFCLFPILHHLGKSEIKEKGIIRPDPLVFILIHSSWIVWTLALFTVISFSPCLLFGSSPISLYKILTLTGLPKYLHGFIIPIILLFSILIGMVIGYRIGDKFYPKYNLDVRDLSISCVICIVFLIITISMNIWCAIEEPSYLKTIANMFTPIILPIATLILLFPFYRDVRGTIISRLERGEE